MRIVTWNIRGGKGMDGVRSLDRIVAGLRELDADVICLQEAHRRLPGGATEDQSAQLERALGGVVVFSSTMRLGRRYGLVLWTRLPVESSACFELPNRRERRSRPGLWLERRICQFAVVETQAGPLLVLNTHWSLDPLDREESAARVVALYPRPGPQCLCGDLNTGPDGAEIRALETAGLRDAGTEAGLPTFPADQPTARIDYVWTRGLIVTRVETPPLPGSDHLPVVVDFEFETV